MGLIKVKRKENCDMIRYNCFHLVFLFLFILGCAATGRESAKMSYKNSEIRIYEVFGMDCPACASGLDKLVKKIPGVLKSEANWKEKRLVITVSNEEQVEDDDIIDAIKQANFTPGKRIK